MHNSKIFTEVAVHGRKINKANAIVVVCGSRDDETAENKARPWEQIDSK